MAGAPSSRRALNAIAVCAACSSPQSLSLGANGSVSGGGPVCAGRVILLPDIICCCLEENWDAWARYELQDAPVGPLMTGMVLWGARQSEAALRWCN